MSEVIDKNCWFGDDCKFLKAGECKFAHDGAPPPFLRCWNGRGCELTGSNGDRSDGARDRCDRWHPGDGAWCPKFRCKDAATGGMWHAPLQDEECKYGTGCKKNPLNLCPFNHTSKPEIEK